jgi:senataxin
MENIQTPVPFYRALLGQLPKDDDEVQVIETKPGPRSTPAENDDYSRTFSGDSGSSMDDSISSSDGSSGSSSGETGATRSDDNTVKLKSQLQTIFRLPRLNEMQESAASCFLNADPNTITLIQGPPGTGKSTLIVAILARLLLEKQNNDDSPRKIMVCCPTNKAISVLCTRFLDCLQDNDYCSFPFSVLLVGDDGKLLDDDVSHSKMSSSSSSKLRSIFLYTWITTLLQDYSKIRNSLAGKDKRRETPESLFELARNLQRRLQTNLPSLPRGVFDTASKISTYLQRLVNSKSLSSHSEILVTVSSLLATIREWKREAIWHQLLSSARVVFCTLASAGAAVLKKSNFVADDLIVDEAAAATEPELSIPFGFHPRRMLAVGDPRQLPAMVGSQRAAQLGLGQSLHERLMYDCGYPHIMLNVQYRMRPELSQFPSQHFYEGKIVNGPNVKR